MIRVVIVEDHASIREMLAGFLKRETGYVVVCQTGCGLEALPLCMNTQPDLVILDLLLRELSGDEVIHLLPAGADRTVGYIYDATGNRMAVNDSVNGNASYSANNLNEYTNVGGASYASDANGNLITGSGVYVYDAQNRLDSAQVGINRDQFYYDSRNRVVARTVKGTLTYFIYDGWDLIEERDSSGELMLTFIPREDTMVWMVATAVVVGVTNQPPMILRMIHLTMGSLHQCTKSCKISD